MYTYYIHTSVPVFPMYVCTVQQIHIPGLVLSVCCFSASIVPSRRGGGEIGQDMDGDGMRFRR